MDIFRRKNEIRLVLSDRSRARLDWLKDMTGSDTDTETIRHAIRALDFLVEQAQVGNSFAVVTPSGELVPVSVFCEPEPESPKPTRFKVIDGGKSTP